MAICRVRRSRYLGFDVIDAFLCSAAEFIGAADGGLEQWLDAPPKRGNVFRRHRGRNADDHAWKKFGSKKGDTDGNRPNCSNPAS